MSDAVQAGGVHSLLCIALIAHPDDFRLVNGKLVWRQQVLCP